MGAPRGCKACTWSPFYARGWDVRRIWPRWCTTCQSAAWCTTPLIPGRKGIGGSDRRQCRENDQWVVRRERTGTNGYVRKQNRARSRQVEEQVRVFVFLQSGPAWGTTHIRLGEVCSTDHPSPWTTENLRGTRPGAPWFTPTLRPRIVWRASAWSRTV